MSKKQDHPPAPRAGGSYLIKGGKLERVAFTKPAPGRGGKPDAPAKPATVKKDT